MRPQGIRPRLFCALLRLMPHRQPEKIRLMESIVELRHLRTLVALQETGSVSLAAQRVFLTQSALSHQIRLLEKPF